jgi:U3 small nucleolar RNA-associated protein 19
MFKSIFKLCLQVLPIIQSLKVYFVECFEGEELQTAAPAPGQTAQQDPHAVFSAWLHRQFSSCIAALLKNISSGTDARTQVSSLSALMEFTRGSRKPGVFDNQLCFKIVSCILLHNKVASAVVGAMLQKYAKHADVYYYLLRAISKLCTRRAAHPGLNRKGSAAAAGDVHGEDSDEEGNEEFNTTASADDFARNVYDILSRISPPSDESTEELQSWCGAAEVGVVAAACDASGPRQRKKQRKEAETNGLSTHNDILANDNSTKPLMNAKWASAKLRRKAYSEAWMSFLCLSLPNDIYRKSLSRLHDLVIPNLTTPLLLSDFLTHSLDRGGLDGMLALNGIFILVTQHGLEYPKFYERLYGLFTPDIFLSRHRLRFFQLADIFLASPMVPAYTAAAFAKRFGRQALSAPPAGALIAIVFIHNLMRRHPACVQLVHRAPPGGLAAVSAKIPKTVEETKLEKKGPVWHGEDVFDALEADPAKTRALESSLWEITALKNHADPSVSRYCSILEKDLSDRKRTAEIDVGDVLTASYTSMFTREVEKRLKSVPAAFYAVEEMPKKVLDEQFNDDFRGWCD